MREIKFRAWEKNMKEIIHVYDIDFEKEMINTNGAWRFFTEVDLMQYIGLKDVNGIEIYEGDIVECGTFDKAGRIINAEVFYDDKRYGYCIKFMDCDVINKYPLYAIINPKVTGNIYEYQYLPKDN